MHTVLAELPLALFTTLASAGAGAYISLALAAFTASLDEEQERKLDRVAWVPLAVTCLGFVASLFHLASPLRVYGVFAGLGSSPLTNEVAVGLVFVVLAAAYALPAFLGKLSGSTRKALLAVAAVAALVFAVFMGAAYMIPTVPSWDTVMSPLLMVGAALAGGALLCILAMELAHVRTEACRGRFKAVLLAEGVAGAALALIAIAAMLAATSGMSSWSTSGAALAAGSAPFAIAGALLLIAAVAALFLAVKRERTLSFAAAGSIAAVVGIFALRLAFYGLQISAGI